MSVRFLAVIFVLFVSVSCTKGGGQNEDYVARIGDVRLTEQDVKDRINNLPPRAMQLFEGDDGMKRFVDEMVKRELLYIGAKRKGMDQDKDVIKKIEDTKKDIVASAYLEKELGASGKITDQDIKAYYDSHKAEFTTRDKVTVSQIVVGSVKEAREVIERLEAGDDFAKVAQEVSIDKATARVGGKIGTFGLNSKTGLNPAFQDVVFKLGMGETSAPMTISGKTYILKITDITGTLVEFEKTKAVIARKLKEEGRSKAMNKILDELMISNKVHINKAAVAKIAEGNKSSGPAKYYETHQ